MRLILKAHETKRSTEPKVSFEFSMNSIENELNRDSLLLMTCQCIYVPIFSLLYFYLHLLGCRI